MMVELEFEIEIVVLNFVSWMQGRLKIRLLDRAKQGRGSGFRPNTIEKRITGIITRASDREVLLLACWLRECCG